MEDYLISPLTNLPIEKTSPSRHLQITNHTQKKGEPVKTGEKEQRQGKTLLMRFIAKAQKQKS